LDLPFWQFDLQEDEIHLCRFGKDYSQEDDASFCPDSLCVANLISICHFGNFRR
jgi:hypothetical protein